MSHDTLRYSALAGAALFLILGVALGGCSGGVALKHDVGLKAGWQFNPSAQYDREADKRRLMQLLDERN